MYVSFCSLESAVLIRAWVDGKDPRCSLGFDLRKSEPTDHFDLGPWSMVYVCDRDASIDFFKQWMV